MYFREPTQDKPIKVRDNPLHRSSSVSGIIHGDSSNTSNHYIDALERFKRDFASVDREERENKRLALQVNQEKRRNFIMERENAIKRNEEENYNRLLERQHQSQMLHGLGAKKTAHTPGIPVNPISLEYHDNPRGDRQAYFDQKQQINRMVRAHNLQTHGTSGYNLINGKASLHVENLLPPVAQEEFKTKLSNFYSRYRIDPNENIK